MGFNLAGSVPKAGGGSFLTVNMVVFFMVAEVTDRMNSGGAAQWQKDQAGSTSRQLSGTLHAVDEDGTVGEELGKAAYFFNIPADSTPARTATGMLNGMRLVAESAGYDAADLDAGTVEPELDDSDLVGGEYVLRGYWFAGDEETTNEDGTVTPGHWGQIVLLTPELFAQAVEGAYTPPKPKLRVKKSRTQAGGDDEETTTVAAPAGPTRQIAGPARPAATAPQPTQRVAAGPAKPATPPASSTPTKPPTAPNKPGSTPPKPGGLRSALTK